MNIYKKLISMFTDKMTPQSINIGRQIQGVLQNTKIQTYK